MEIGVIGGGYVGLVTAGCLAEKGHIIHIVEKSKEKLAILRSGGIPIEEPGLEEIFQRNRERISVHENVSELGDSVDAIFIAVGTPTVNNRQDLSQIKGACEEVGKYISAAKRRITVIIKSTVLPTAIKNVIIPTLEKASGKKVGEDFGFAINPEFLREGNAVHDFMNPDRIVIGPVDEKSEQCLREIYKEFDAPVLAVPPETASMIKYASNAILATKISFINEIGNICKKIGIDVRDVARGVGLDHRVSSHFLRAGIGFGGSCFPKDVKALKTLSEDLGEKAHLLSAVLTVNEIQPLKAIELLEKHISSLKGKKIAVLGLAFKPNTDDVRETRSAPLIKALLEKGALVLAHDPSAVKNFRRSYPDLDIKVVDDPQRAVSEADGIIIATDWDIYSRLDYSGKIVIDGRGIEINGKHVIYEGVCW